MSNNRKKDRMLRTAAGITLSLSVAFGGTMLAVPQQAQAAVSSTSIADQVISTGKQFLGVRYQFGAKSGRTDAFDCSSFTQYIFKQNGIDLPRNSRQQSKVGTYVPKDQLQAGDLVFSDTNRDGVINHVSVYMGDGKVLHTYRVGIGVTISDFKGSTWDKTFVTARRVISGSGGQAPAQPSVPDTNETSASIEKAPQAEKQAEKQNEISHKRWTYSKSWESYKRNYERNYERNYKWNYERNHEHNEQREH